MERYVSIEDALRCAVLTAQEQPYEVPEAPDGWLQEALDALESGDPTAINIAAERVRVAHSQYRAEFDIKGWLYELRNTLRAGAH